MAHYRLVVMRLANMHRVHPQQDESRVCGTCQHQVGIYPSGQEVLALYPDTDIICEVCNDKYPPAPSRLAPGALNEPFESVDKKPGS